MTFNYPITNLLPPGHFEHQMVAAIIKRGPMTNYSDITVSASGNVLIVSYKAEASPPGTASFAAPLILSVPNTYRRVLFVENGQPVGTRNP